MERRIELIEPSGRRFDLTPRTRGERVRSGAGTAVLLLLSLLLWTLPFLPLWRAFGF